MDNRFTAQGTIFPVSAVVLNSVSGGEAVKLPVQAGTPVKEGDVLVKMGFASQTELDTLKVQRDSAYQARQQARDDNSEGTRVFYKAQIDSYEKQLAMIEETVSPGTIKMPFDGVVWEMYAEVGKYLAPNQPAVKVYARGYSLSGRRGAAGGCDIYGGYR